MKGPSMNKIFALVFFAAAAFGQAAKPIDKPAIEAYLRRLELWIPDVKVTIDDPKPYVKNFSELVVHLTYNGQGKEERYFITDDGQNIIKGEPFDLAVSPFQANLDRIQLEGQPSFGGGANAPVNLVIFADFQCPYCKSEAEVVRKNVQQTFADKVRVTFKDFPLEAIHPWARAGSIAGRCVFKQSPEKFWTFHDWIYANQGEVTGENLHDKVTAWAGENGVDAAAVGTCMSTKATDAEVTKNLEEGRALSLNATPTVFLNGFKMEGTVQWPVLEQLIKMELTRLGDK